MTVERVFHCDGPGCQTHQRTLDSVAPRSWIRADWEYEHLQFCTWDCVLRYGARFEPVERVEA